MVVFEDGLARKSEYRRFVIKGTEVQWRGRAERRGPHAPGHHPAVPAAARRAGAVDRGGDRERPDAGRPRDRPAAQVRLRARPGRRRRRAAPGGGRPAGARRARHRRHPGLRAGQAARGGVAARPRGPGHPGPLQRGPLPPPAGARRGAPVRDHPPPLAAQQVDGREPARRRPRARGGTPQDAAQALRLVAQAPGRHRRRDRAGARDRRTHRDRHQGCGGAVERQDCLREHRHRRDRRGT